jgi:hypothetical protein
VYRSTVLYVLLSSVVHSDQTLQKAGKTGNVRSRIDTELQYASGFKVKSAGRPPRGVNIKVQSTGFVNTFASLNPREVSLHL